MPRQEGPGQIPPRMTAKDLNDRSNQVVDDLAESWKKHTDRWNRLLDNAENGTLDAGTVTSEYTQCVKQVFEDTISWISLWLPGGIGSPKAPEQRFESFPVTVTEEVTLSVVDCCNINDKKMKPKVGALYPPTVAAGTHEVTVELDASDVVNGLYHLELKLAPTGGGKATNYGHIFPIDEHPAA